MTETHPLKPFLPASAKILLLGSFPPKQEKWSMDFFYPNFINDMWRITGLVFFGDRDYFVIQGARKFDREKIVRFCMEKGIAMYDTASEVRRLKDNASDKFLEIVGRTDISALLDALPECRALAATGGKACEAAAEFFGCRIPATGGCTEIGLPPVADNGQKILRFYRMPSSSRAYPLSLAKKAEYYETMYRAEKLLP